MLKVGDKLPAGTLSKFIEVVGKGGSTGPKTFDTSDKVVGKTIAVFASPGAFTPTRSAKHVPG